MEYRVTWTVDVDAENKRDAAIKARAMQLRPGTTATVFEVVARKNGEEFDLRDEFDLAEYDDNSGMRQCLGVCFGHGPVGGEAVYCDGRCNPDD
jgi:hypothetical protein